MKNREKISTGETDFEKQERGKNELDEITNAFLENADPDDINTREVYQKELKTVLKTAEPEEREYAESLIRLKGIQYKDWTEQGFPMKEIKMSKEKAIENKSDSDIEIKKIIFETKKVPATLLTLTENDIKMIEISNNPDKFDKLTKIKKEFVEKWQKKYEGFATSDEQAGEMQKFVNAHEKIPENRASEIQTLVSRAFPEYFCIERPWKKKERSQKEDIDSSYLPDIGDNYAA